VALTTEIGASDRQTNVQGKEKGHESVHILLEPLLAAGRAEKERDSHILAKSRILRHMYISLNINN
jgi:hypothetical protein